MYREERKICKKEREKENLERRKERRKLLTVTVEIYMLYVKY